MCTCVTCTSGVACTFLRCVPLAGHVGVVSALVSSSDERFVISAGGDAMIRVWDAHDLSYVRTLRCAGAGACMGAGGSSAQACSVFSVLLMLWTRPALV